MEGEGVKIDSRGVSTPAELSLQLGDKMRSLAHNLTLLRAVSYTLTVFLAKIRIEDNIFHCYSNQLGLTCSPQIGWAIDLGILI